MEILIVAAGLIIAVVVGLAVVRTGVAAQHGAKAAQKWWDAQLQRMEQDKGYRALVIVGVLVGLAILAYAASYADDLSKARARDERERLREERWEKREQERKQARTRPGRD